MTTQASMALRHQTAFLEEAVDAPAWRDGGIYIDGTLGRGGHSRRILEQLEPGGRPVALGKDPAVITKAGTIEGTRFVIEHDSFAQTVQCLDARNIERVAGVLLDLGISSSQIDEDVRGFLFRMDGSLDMQMDTMRGITVAQWLTEADECDIARVIRDYGEERFAVQTTEAIATRRGQSGNRGSLDRTSELATFVVQAVKTHKRGQDPATRTFQALRTRVNQELANLETGLKAALERLEQEGRLAVISFHSLEDRIVKHFMQALARPEQSVTPELRQAPLYTHELPMP